MGLASVIQKATQVAFKAIGDIPLICTFTSRGSSNYNTTTGSSYSFDETCENIKVVFEDYSIREVQEAGGHILNTDKKASIVANTLVSELSEVITPKALDYITDETDIKWAIQKTNIDSAKALWILQIRRLA